MDFGTELLFSAITHCFILVQLGYRRDGAKLGELQLCLDKN